MEIEEIIKSENVEELLKYNDENKLRTGDHHHIIKLINKSSWNIDNFDTSNSLLKFYKFNVDLLRIKNSNDQMDYIDNHLDYFDSWFSVDETLTILYKKDIDFDRIFKRSKIYVNDKREFVARFGYVVFLASLINKDTIYKIAELFHDDDRYYVQMAEAWLMSMMVVKCPEEGYEIIKSHCNLDYKVIGKAIQKCLDSFRISKEMKEKIRALRNEYR